MMNKSILDNLSGDFALVPAFSRLGFVARQAVVTHVRGAFKDFAGYAHLDPEEPTRNGILVEVQTASVDTGTRKRDAHLRSSDFFDVPRFPVMTYRSRDIRRVGNAVLRTVGELTLHGITEPLTMDLRYQGASTNLHGDERQSFVASAVISRRTWRIGARDTGDIVIADKVKLDLDLCARHIARPMATEDAAAQADVADTVPSPTPRSPGSTGPGASVATPAPPPTSRPSSAYIVGRP